MENTKKQLITIEDAWKKFRCSKSASRVYGKMTYTYCKYSTLEELKSFFIRKYFKTVKDVSEMKMLYLTAQPPEGSQKKKLYLHFVRKITATKFTENRIKFREEWQQRVAEEKYRLKYKNGIFEALLLWKFIRESSVNEEEKREFIKNFLDHSNEFISLVARITLLPVKLWRKILWKENIDFQSYESFLRRLTPKQGEAIQKAYDEYVVTGSTNCKEYLVPKYNSKGAWAFNLLGLDFGFSLYPHGLNDDRMITNKKYTRFFSVKEHIHDFVVNQENGKYWGLYKSARSNYVWQPDKDVKLSDHICPGFWWTLIIHLCFWILSPVLFTLATMNLVHHGSPENWGNGFAYILPIVLTGLTPLWLLIAGIKKIISLFMKVPEKVYEKIGIVVGMIAALALVLAVITGIGVCIYRMYVEVMPFFERILGIGKLAAFLTTTTIVLHVLYALLHLGDDDWRENLRMKYKAMPTIIKLVFAYAIINPVLQWFELYTWDRMVYFAMMGVNLLIAFWGAILKFAQNLIWFVTTYPVLILMPIVSVMMVVVFNKILTWVEDNEVKFAKYSRKLKWGVVAWIVFIGYLFCSQLDTISISWDGFASGIGVGLVIVIALASVAWALMVLMFSFEINPETIDVRLSAAQSSEFIRKKFSFGWGENKIIRKWILKNPWLSLLLDRKRKEVISKLEKVTARIFGYSDNYSRLFLRIVLPVLNGSRLDYLAETAPKVCMYADRSRYLSTDDAKIFLIRLLLKGYPLIMAVEQLRKTEQAILDRRERGRARVQRIISFFDYLVWPFAYSGRKIYQFFATLKDIWSLFNERCPYVSKAQVLK